MDTPYTRLYRIFLAGEWLGLDGQDQTLLYEETSAEVENQRVGLAQLLAQGELLKTGAQQNSADISISSREILFMP